MLYTYPGNGKFREDTKLLPVEPFYNLTAAAWIDYDGDGRPDLLLGNGFHGLRFYRNKGKAEPQRSQPGKPTAPLLCFEDASVSVGHGAFCLVTRFSCDTLTICIPNDA